MYTLNSHVVISISYFLGWNIISWNIICSINMPSLDLSTDILDLNGLRAADPVHQNTTQLKVLLWPQVRLSQLISLKPIYLLHCCFRFNFAPIQTVVFFSSPCRMMCLYMKKLNEKWSWLTFLIHVILVPKTCSLNLCRNGATCLEDRPSNPCLCAPGYSGRYCTGKSLHVHIQTGHWRFYVLDSELLKINLKFQTDCIKLRDSVSSVPKSGLEK